MMDENPNMNDISKLIRKNLDETEIGNNMVVYSQRTAFVYGDESSEMKKVAIEDFLIRILSDKGPITRGTLASLTNIPRTTLYDILAKLISNGQVEKKPVRTKKRGRPKILFYVKR
ncbi:MAG: TrmB family transcriptional regulator [Asgard group archaeon]|nr:TrmB family transcriptional regulator [Asgard group archaeon]